MILVNKTGKRHKIETEILKNALGSDVFAANRVHVYLSSSNPTMRRIMQKSIYDLADIRMWNQLLSCLSIQRWNDHLDCDRRNDPAASQRINQTIIELFLQDVSEDDKYL
jgi:hypothetical protein